MTNSGISAEELLSALPPVLRADRRMLALGQVVADVLALRYDEIDKVAIYAHIDELDEAMLDILAYDFKVDWYGYDYPVEVKRRILKSSFYVHRHLGTKGAVETAIQALYPRSAVEEWFDYIEGGAPYSFRIVLDASEPSVPVSSSDLLREINQYKSLRSHLDGIMFRSNHPFLILTGCGWTAFTARVCGTYPVLARQGFIENHSIVAKTESGGTAYTMPMTNQQVAGAFPRPAVRGVAIDAALTIDTANDGECYTSPMTGPAISGEHPAAAVQGSILDGILATEATAGDAQYDVTPCGTAPGSLF